MGGQWAAEGGRGAAMARGRSSGTAVWEEGASVAVTPALLLLPGRPGVAGSSAVRAWALMSLAFYSHPWRTCLSVYLSLSLVSPLVC